MRGYHRNKDSSQKPVRNYVKSHINHIMNHKEQLDNFIFPSKASYTYNWWDCKPYKPKVFKLI